MAVLTLTLQAAAALSFVAFGLLSVAVHRRTPGARADHRLSWLLIGGGFTLHGLALLFHTLWAVAAYVAGSGADLYETFLVWTAPMNHSRTFLLLGLTFAILAHAMLPHPRSRRFAGGAAVLIGAGFAGGLVVGRVEPEMSALTHFSAVATWDVVQLVVLLVALFVALLTSRMDRYAWTALAVYAFSLALNVMWLAALSRTDLPGEWAPRPWMIAAYRLVLTLAMVAVAVRRLQLARRGVPVSALMDSSPSRLRMVG